VVISKKIAPTKNTSCMGSAGMTERRNWAACFIDKPLAGQRIMSWLVNEKPYQIHGYFTPMSFSNSDSVKRLQRCFLFTQATLYNS